MKNKPNFEWLRYKPGNKLQKEHLEELCANQDEAPYVLGCTYRGHGFYKFLIASETGFVMSVTEDWDIREA